MGSPEDPSLLLDDILAEIAFLERAVEGRSAADLLDAVLARAVQYSMLSIGEAAKRLPPEVRARHPEIPWSHIMRNRDFLAHGYDRVTPEILWATLCDDILPLRVALQRARALEHRPAR